MLMAHHEETIVAQCTPAGSGALGIIRLSGKNAISVADNIALLASKKKLSALPSHTIHYGSIVYDDILIDHVLFLLMHGPQTFTGQNTVEITCHNNPFIIESIINSAIKAGARIAQNGEFTQRAVINNKIDLLQAEAINELIHANTQIALKQSLAQLDGSFSQWIYRIEKQLIKALALSEASFEFIDEENMEFGVQINGIIEETNNTITTLKKIYDAQKQIREGVRIALIGTVNAGKSSLFNTLLNQDRSIVTNTAGTTRDVIEAGIYEKGNYWTIIDTAGIRQSNDSIEKEGVARSYQEAKKADIILLIMDGSRDLSKSEKEVYLDIYNSYHTKTILIQSKSDLSQKIISPFQALAIKTSHGNQESVISIKKAIQSKIEALFCSIESPFLLNQRQVKLLESLSQKLKNIGQLLHGDISYEIISHHLTDAISSLSELTGKSITEAGMDAVFRDFCIGK